MKREFHVRFCEGLGVEFPRPTRQHFTGEVIFQHRPPIDPSSLTRWRKRIGEEGAEWLLTKTIEAGRRSGAVEDRSLSRVAVDTTVMEKKIAQPDQCPPVREGTRQACRPCR